MRLRRGHSYLLFQWCNRPTVVITGLRLQRQQHQPPTTTTSIANNNNINRQQEQHQSPTTTTSIANKSNISRQQQQHQPPPTLSITNNINHQQQQHLRTTPSSFPPAFKETLPEGQRLIFDLLRISTFAKKSSVGWHCAPLRMVPWRTLHGGEDRFLEDLADGSSIDCRCRN